MWLYGCMLGMYISTFSTVTGAPLPIIDTHTHMSNISRFKYVDDWCKTSFGKVNYSADSSKSLKLTPKHYIFMEASVIPSQNIAEAEWVQSQVDTPPINIGGIMAFLPLEDGKKILPALKSLLKLPNFRGIRRILDPKPDDPCWFLTTDFLDALGLLRDHSLNFELLTRTPLQWSCAVDLIRQAPNDLTVVLQHLGNPNMTISPDPHFDRWKQYITEMSQLKNVVAKVSGVPERAVGSVNPFDDWTMDIVAPYIDHVISSFGYDRSMFGGNWFVVKTFSTFERWSDAIYNHLQKQGASDKEMVSFFYDNAKKHYRILD